MQLKDTNKVDSLNRKQISEKYVSLIKALEGSYVIALDAPWGSGKTRLLEYMEKDLKKENIAFINYNAWENDYTEEPFLSLISEFHSQVKEKKYLPNIAKFESFKKVSYKVSKKVVPSVVKGLAQYFIGTEAVKDIEGGAKEIVQSLISDVPSKVVDEVFEAIDASKHSRLNFKKELKEITTEIIKNQECKKLVIIIDELDRCRPTFAIELLENIKHLFDIDNITFLISVDKTQLSESIKAVYGSGFDAMGYLKRFFNFDLHLKFDQDTFFIEHKFKVFFRNLELQDIGGKDLVLEVFRTLKLSLRDYEQILAEIYLLYKMSGNIDLKTYFVLLCLKYKHNESYMYLINNQHLRLNEHRTKIHNTYNRLILDIYNKLWKPTDKSEQPLSEDIKKAINIVESTLG